MLSKRKPYIKPALFWYLILFIVFIIPLSLPYFRSSFNLVRVFLVLLIAGFLMTFFLIRDFKKANKILVYLGMSSIVIIPSLILAYTFISNSQEFPSYIMTEYNYTCSMYHKEKNLDAWWERKEYLYDDYNITKEKFERFPFPDGIRYGSSPIKTNNISLSEVNIGDVLVYLRSENKRVIHRLIGFNNIKNETLYVFMGDNDNAFEYIKAENILEKAYERKLDKFLYFFLKEGCIAKQSDYKFCKGESRDLCKDENLKECCKINEIDRREDCFFNIKKNPDPELCCSFKSYRKNGCFTNFALKYNDSNFCELIPDKDSRKDCYYDIGVQTGNLSQCKKFQLLTLACKSNLTKKECISNHIDFYYPTNDAYEKVDECFKKTAELNINLSICDEIYYNKTINECRLNIASKSLNLEYCRLNSKIKQECLIKIAVNSKNHTICDSTDNISECYSQVGIDRFNSNCEELSMHLLLSKVLKNIWGY